MSNVSKEATTLLVHLLELKSKLSPAGQAAVQRNQQGARAVIEAGRARDDGAPLLGMLIEALTEMMDTTLTDAAPELQEKGHAPTQH